MDTLGGSTNIRTAYKSQFGHQTFVFSYILIVHGPCHRRFCQLESSRCLPLPSYVPASHCAWDQRDVHCTRKRPATDTREDAGARVQAKNLAGPDNDRSWPLNQKQSHGRTTRGPTRVATRQHVTALPIVHQPRGPRPININLTLDLNSLL